MNEDTEWNDLLRAHGILPPLPKKTESDNDEKNDTASDAVEASPGSEWEDLEDDQVVQAYMQRRREEIKAYAERAKYGEILPIQRAEWATEVNEASKTASVIVFLYKDAILASRQLSMILVQLANEHPYIKIVKIQGDQAIEGYPDKNLPTLLAYYKGELVGQKISVSVNVKIEEIEEWLIKMSVVEYKEVNRHRRLRICRTEPRDDIDELEEV
ncbi:uncharacterized protein T551_01419 [Pneumocystis jirovecii RU7]|uniref:Phosducin domain-containing protein n=1 Tax=Pneumocystis jirovecii (strain RU7) TaxID=1408657 RepID=A0A0W4ZSK9_PNEJ7|nr:uncharacterized protein T551_01419 [Pneumocystis jirovecii RU7]KTW31347.1 hypothetical protein T551_01419 [Pneumocystis jirovecii RU7]